MSLGDRIRKLREERGMSSPALASASGVSRAYLWQLETGGKTQPSFEILEKLARALGVAVSEFSETPPPPAATKALPAGLAQFITQHGRTLGVTATDVEVMKQIHFRNKRPENPEDWELLFLFLKKWVR